MRLIVIGTEYTGKSTLINAIQDWSAPHGIRYHLDDHFSMPDCQMLRNAGDQKVMLGLPQIIKERFQRFQVAYHVRLINKYEHIILGGFHIEEWIYGPRYYYPAIARSPEGPQAWEAGMPADTILCLLTADPAVLNRRMSEGPHEYPIVPENDIAAVQEAFLHEFRQSWIKRKFQIDTSKLTPKSLLDAFLSGVTPHLDTRDLLIRQASK